MRWLGEAVAGDALSLSIWAEVSGRLWQALAMLIDTLNLGLVVIARIYAREEIGNCGSIATAQPGLLRFNCE